MRLTSTYKHLIQESIIIEDRNQAKALLKKVGMTTDGWTINQNYENPPLAIFMVTMLKGLSDVLIKNSVAKDYGRWANVMVKSYSPEYDDYEDLGPNYMVRYINEMYGYAHSVKVDPLPMIEEKVGGDDLESLISRVNYELGDIWINEYITKYIDPEIIKALENSDLDHLRRVLEPAMFDQPVKERLIRIHKKISNFSKIKSNGMERSYDEILGIIDYVNAMVEGNMYDDDELNGIKTDSDGNIIWEANNQLVVQIDYDSVNNEQFCHGSENWCIIMNPDEHWDTYGGDSTYVLFTKDELTPYNRIAIIYRPSGLEYWDDDDKNITRKIAKYVPNHKEIEAAILEKGVLDRHTQTKVNQLHQGYEDLISGYRYLDMYDIIDLHMFDDLMEEYWGDYMEKMFPTESYQDEIYTERLIPKEYADFYYNTCVKQINTTSLVSINSLELIDLPDKYRKLIDPLDKRFLRQLINDEISIHKILIFQDYEVVTNAGRYILNAIKTNDPILNKIDVTDSVIAAIFRKGFNLNDVEIYEYFNNIIFNELYGNMPNQKLLNYIDFNSFEIKVKYSSKLFTRLLEIDLDILKIQYNLDSEFLINYLYYIKDNLNNVKLKSEIKETLIPYINDGNKSSNIKDAEEILEVLGYF